MMLDDSDRSNVSTESWGVFKITSKAQTICYLFHKKHSIIDVWQGPKYEPEFWTH